MLRKTAILLKRPSAGKKVRDHRRGDDRELGAASRCWWRWRESTSVSAKRCWLELPHASAWDPSRRSSLKTCHWHVFYTLRSRLPPRSALNGAHWAPAPLSGPIPAFLKFQPSPKGPGWIFGGDGGNRTRVRKRVTGAFYERSFCFKLPAARRPKAGFWLW